GVRAGLERARARDPRRLARTGRQEPLWPGRRTRRCRARGPLSSRAPGGALQHARARHSLRAARARGARSGGAEAGAALARGHRRGLRGCAPRPARPAHEGGARLGGGIGRGPRLVVARALPAGVASRRGHVAAGTGAAAEGAAADLPCGVLVPRQPRGAARGVLRGGARDASAGAARGAGSGGGTRATARAVGGRDGILVRVPPAARPGDGLRPREPGDGLRRRGHRGAAAVRDRPDQPGVGAVRVSSSGPARRGGLAMHGEKNMRTARKYLTLAAAVALCGACSGGPPLLADPAAKFELPPLQTSVPEYQLIMDPETLAKFY